MKVNLKKSNQEIDWTIQQLVISKQNNVIVLTTGRSYEYSFEGLSIANEDNKQEFSQKWEKSSFELFLGTISND